MATRYYPFDSGQGGAVTEQEWSKMTRHWMNTGVIQGGLNNFEVYADSTGMNVKVKSGEAWIKGHYFESDEEEVLPFAQADGSNPRIDRVVIRLDWGENRIELAVLQGVPAVSPVAPALTQNTARWEISLARIRVDAGVNTIPNNKVTDEREYTGSQQAEWQNITLQNGWQPGIYLPQYSVIGNRVIFRGRIKGGLLGGTEYIPAFTLPFEFQNSISASYLVGGYTTLDWARIYTISKFSTSTPYSGGVSVVKTSTGTTDGEIELSVMSYSLDRGVYAE